MRMMVVRAAAAGLATLLVTSTGWSQRNFILQPTPMPEPERTFHVRPKSDFNPPKVTSKTKPAYPPEVAALGIEGTVDVALHVDAQGQPRNPRIIRSDNVLLIPTALATVMEWTYRPGSFLGANMGAELEVTVKFSLSEREQRKAAEKLPDTAPVQAVYQVAPDYPDGAELLAMAGEVLVEFWVTEKGEMQNPRVVKTSHAVFNEAALHAIKQWGFIPARAHGQNKATRMQVPFVFKQPQSQPKQETQIAQQRTPPQKIQTPDPQRQQWAGAVYPFTELLENKQATVEATVEQTPDGRIAVARWHGEVAPAFQFAIQALLDTKTPDELPPLTRETVRWEFNPYDGDVRITNAAAAILKQLRMGDTAFVKEDALDLPPTLVARIEPVFPTQLPTDVQNGEATIEFFVGENGRVLLPKIVSASAPEFAYAASQAVAGWQFMFPRKNNETTIALLQRKFEFARRAGGSVDETVDISAFNQSTKPSEHEVDAEPVADKLVMPDYPQDLRHEGIRGTVVLSFIVTPKGNVVNLRVENQTQEAFAEAASNALKQSTFIPGRKDGRPVHTRMQVVVHFTDPLTQSTGLYEMPVGLRKS